MTQTLVAPADAAPAAEAAESDHPLLGARYKTRFVVLMLIVAAFNFADRSVFSAVAQTIKQDLALTDLDLGLLQGLGFAIVYALVGLPIGWLAERTKRLGIITVCLAIWSVMTVATGLAGGFFQLLFARVGVGLGEAGFISPVTSLVSDHFGARRRASGMALVMLGLPLGTLIGAAGGGWIAQHYGWRNAFIVFGVPGLLLSLVVMLFLTEPPRGLSDGRSSAPTAKPTLGAFLAMVRSKPALRNVLIGGPLAGFGMTCISQFMAPFLARSYHLPVGQAGALFGFVSAAALTIGLLVGAFGSDAAAHRDQRWSAWGPAIGLGVSPIIFFLAFHQASLLASSLLLLAGTASMLCYYTPAIGLIQNMCPPHMRAMAAAVYATLYSLIGLAFGPTFVGFTSDHLAKLYWTGAGLFATACPGGIGLKGAGVAIDALCREVSARGLRDALSIGVCIQFWAALHFVLAARTYRRDLHVAEEA